jgi:hypothetical protein
MRLLGDRVSPAPLGKSLLNTIGTHSATRRTWRSTGGKPTILITVDPDLAAKADKVVPMTPILDLLTGE